MLAGGIAFFSRILRRRTEQLDSILNHYAADYRRTYAGICQLEQESRHAQRNAHYDRDLYRDIGSVLETIFVRIMNPRSSFYTKKMTPSLTAWRLRLPSWTRNSSRPCKSGVFYRNA